MAWECPTPATALNQSGGTEGMWPNHCQCQPQQPTAGPQHFLPDPRPKLTSMKVAQRMGWPEAAPVPFCNPDPIACLVGCSNEAPVIMDRQRMTVVIDSGDQVSSISSQFCKDLALQIQPLGWVLELEAPQDSLPDPRPKLMSMKGGIPYLWFIEVNLQIPGIKNYNEDMLLLVIPAMTYSEKIPVMVGSKIIDRAMRIITKVEFMKVTTTWKQALFRPVMSRSLQLPCTG